MRIIGLVILLASSVLAQDINDESKKALQGSYQDMRNVAFSLSQINDKQAKVGACGMRKAIIITNPDKLDISDYTNEHIDCGQIHATENQQAWEYAFSIVKAVSDFRSTSK